MNSFMKVAKNLAEENLKTNAGGPFGACIVKEGRIIGKGSNIVLKSNDPIAHAEIVAIRDACENLGTYDLSGCELFSTCYPCPMCLSAIIWANIKKVYYGDTAEDAASIGFRDEMIYDYIENLAKNNEKEEILDLVPMDRDETIKAFDAFMKKRNKVIY